MKSFALLSLGALAGLFCGGSAQGNTSALDALVLRQLPFHADSFVFHLPEEEVQVNVRTHSALDTFTLFDGSDGKVNIECSTKSACSRGLYTYISQLQLKLTGNIDILLRSGKWIYTGLEVGWVNCLTNYPQ